MKMITKSYKYLLNYIKYNNKKKFKNVPASLKTKNTKIRILSKSCLQSNVAVIGVPLQILIKFWYQPT